MNSTTVWPGVLDPDFIGETQHTTATNVVADVNCSKKLSILRENIRNFRREAGVTGHITVIWSASVERPSLLELTEVQELMDAIESNNSEISPSILYATAALFENCSFVNGGSQNTLSPALYKLDLHQGSYRSEEPTIELPSLM